jgi:RNA polymerase sigma-70 factor (ECF subfamily)
MARTRAIDRVRVGVALRNAQEPIERGLDVACERPGPEAAYGIDERRRRVIAALAALPPEQRATLDLAYYEGSSQTEIAARLGLPLGTVKTRMRLGMAKLRDLLAAGGLQ